MKREGKSVKNRCLFVIFALIICAFLFGCGEKSELPSQENAEMAENKLQDTVSVSENFETKETESKKQKDNLEKKNDESNQQKIESEKNDEPILENIDLNKYITVITSGVDGCGELHAFLDRESFYLDYMDAIKFKNSSAERTFYSLYTQCENKNPTEAFFFFIDNGLSTIEYNFRYDIHQEEYSFSTDGYWTISEVESELQFNPSLYHLERKTF